MASLELRVCGRYRLGRRIGRGTFGQIYLTKNIQNNMDCATKLEEIRTKYPQVLYEGKMLQSLQGGKGIPNMYWCGQEGDFNFLIMELLGDNLEEIFVKCRRYFSLKTIVMLADRLLQNIEYLHFKSLLHRDLKPENFLIGAMPNKQHKIFTIDYGLAKKYRDSVTHEHIPFREKKPLIGTARYASVNAHIGFELSRRDDLETLGYIIIYFARQGRLPWQGIEARTKEEKYQLIKEKKLQMTTEELCRGLPIQFKQYLDYCRALKFDEQPDYQRLRRLFKEIMLENAYEFDNLYDWLVYPTGSLQYSLDEMDQLPLHLPIIANEQEFLKEMGLSDEVIAQNEKLYIPGHEDEEDEEEEEQDRVVQTRAGIYLDSVEEAGNYAARAVHILPDGADYFMPSKRTMMGRIPKDAADRPLDEIKMTERELQVRVEQQIRESKNLKQQQRLHVQMLKHHQYNRNEKELIETQRTERRNNSIFMGNLGNIVITSQAVNTIQSQSNQPPINVNNRGGGYARGGIDVSALNAPHSHRGSVQNPATMSLHSNLVTQGNQNAGSNGLAAVELQKVAVKQKKKSSGGCVIF